MIIIHRNSLKLYQDTCKNINKDKLKNTNKDKIKNTNKDKIKNTNKDKFKDTNIDIKKYTNRNSIENRNIKGKIGKELKSYHQMSEAFINCIFLALSGGFQDAYTYFTRDKVFSNAQTGNVVLMSENFVNGDWKAGLRYFFPLFAFFVGILIAELFHDKHKDAKKLHWRQGILLFEIIILFIVGYIPENGNLIATFLVSMSCALQVQTFRKINGYTYASTMCIGNLRTGTESLQKFISHRDKNALKKSLYYFGIILMFAIGAGIGGKISIIFGIHSIWISCILLLISFLFMFREFI